MLPIKNADVIDLSINSLRQVVYYFTCLYVDEARNCNVFIQIPMLKITTAYYKYKHHCDHDVKLAGHAPYGHRHVVLSAVSLTGEYASPTKASPTKPALAGV